MSFNEQINILESNKTTYYENIKCCFCKNNSEIFPNDFYELISDTEDIYHCHLECLTGLCRKFCKNNVLRMNNTIILEIKLCNRFGERKNSKNYIEDI